MLLALFSGLNLRTAPNRTEKFDRELLLSSVFSQISQLPVAIGCTTVEVLIPYSVAGRLSFSLIFRLFISSYSSGIASHAQWHGNFWIVVAMAKGGQCI